MVGANQEPSWHIVGAADYNGDGKSDILWQNDNGQASIWLMNGTTPTFEGLVAPIRARAGTSTPPPDRQPTLAGPRGGEGGYRAIGATKGLPNDSGRRAGGLKHAASRVT